MLERILQAVNTPGAHILICLVLLVLFSSALTATPLSHDIAIFALGILSRSMGSGNKPESQPPNTTTTATTSTTTAPPPDEIKTAESSIVVKG